MINNLYLAVLDSVEEEDFSKAISGNETIKP